MEKNTPQSNLETNGLIKQIIFSHLLSLPFSFFLWVCAEEKEEARRSGRGQNEEVPTSLFVMDGESKLNNTFNELLN